MKKHRIWLFAAFALFVVAAWLMTVRSPAKQAKSRHKREDFPHYLRPKEMDRAAARRTLPPAQKADAAQDAFEQPIRRDPLLAALPPIDPKKGGSAVVVEASVIRETPVGKLLIDCMLVNDDAGPEKFQEKFGLDPLKDIDRIAVTDEGVVVDGNFGQVDWAKVAPELTATQYGEHATIYENSKEEGGQVLGVYNDELLIVAKDTASVQAAMDRISGGVESVPPIDENETYGEIYGVISPEAIAKLLGDEQPDLAERLRKVADRIELHVDATSDVLIVADVTGGDNEQVGDLGRTLGGALSLARIKANANNDADLAELLELARVMQHDGPFTVEMALPLELLEEKLADCRKDRKDQTE